MGPASRGCGWRASNSQESWPRPKPTVFGWEGIPQRVSVATSIISWYLVPPSQRFFIKQARAATSCEESDPGGNEHPLGCGGEGRPTRSHPYLPASGPGRACHSQFDAPSTSVPPGHARRMCTSRYELKLRCCSQDGPGTPPSRTCQGQPLTSITRRSQGRTGEEMRWGPGSRRSLPTGPLPASGGASVTTCVGTHGWRKWVAVGRPQDPSS